LLFLLSACREGEVILKAYSSRHRTGELVQLTQKDIDTLKEIENRLDAAIKQYGDHGAFVKLTHRSPKDVALDKDNAKTKAIFLEKLKHINKNDRGAIAIAWVTALQESLKVFSGKEALNLLIDSYRIREDLRADVEYPDFFKSKLVVRKFVHVDLSLEFRGFVSNKKLTALSQYESGVFFKKLVPKKKMIEKEIVQFFEKEVKDNIALSSYVIDFCIVDGKVMIVDLNPFHANTGGGLFTWREDRNLILNGPFSFRILEHPPKEDPLDKIPQYWIDLINDFYSNAEQNQRMWTYGFLALAAFVLVANVLLMRQRSK